MDFVGLNLFGFESICDLNLFCDELLLVNCGFSYFVYLSQIEAIYISQSIYQSTYINLSQDI
jgi:hypothetical protein